MAVRISKGTARQAIRRFYPAAESGPELSLARLVALEGSFDPDKSLLVPRRLLRYFCVLIILGLG